MCAVFSLTVLEIERRQAVDSDLTHTRDLVLHSVLTFDPSGLHHVVTGVKNRLPTIGSECPCTLIRALHLLSLLCSH